MIPRIANQSQPENWRQALQMAVKTPAELLEKLGLQAHLERHQNSLAERSFAARIPLPFVQRMQYGNPLDPLLRQVLPDLAEDVVSAGYSQDPVGDLQAKTSPGLLHKYHGRVLFIMTGACAINCRYCFRRHFPYQDQSATPNQWQQALDYIAQQPSISEVILSGGDPLMLSSAKLSAFSRKLESIPHLRRIRIHTRTPIVLPQRVTANLLDWLKQIKLPKVIVLHVNHANEMDAETDQVCAALKASGATLLNQAVLLSGVNDSSTAQVNLAERLFEAGILPYYLHQLDAVQGAGHFALDQAKIRKIIHETRILLPGYLMPRYVQEKPGMPYKVPLL